MVRGLHKMWKLPIGYFLVKNGASGADLKKLVLEACQKVRSIGFVPKVLICDQGPNNQLLEGLLQVNEENPSFFTDEYPDERIAFMHDPPRLIKNMRNNVKKI